MAKEDNCGAPTWRAEKTLLVLKKGSLSIFSHQQGSLTGIGGWLSIDAASHGYRIEPNGEAHCNQHGLLVYQLSGGHDLFPFLCVSLKSSCASTSPIVSES